jgi:hypothetical protein
MALQLTSHFVAFIDILGFSEMVRSDCESSGAPRYLELLHASHLRANALFSQDLEAGLIQFSDSIVFSRPFDLSALPRFLEAIAQWQRSLLLDGLLCRGGVTFGKHFVRDKFLFSKAMIDAYLLESAHARYPRIIVSEDLLQLASEHVPASALRLLQEDDGAVFVDYLRCDTDGEKTDLRDAVARINATGKDLNLSAQEKVRWIARYADHSLGTTLAIPQFTAVHK